MSNLAILGAKNSVKRSVCGIEAPVRKLIFRTRTIEGLELVTDPPGDRVGNSVAPPGLVGDTWVSPPGMGLGIKQAEIPITELFFSEVTTFLLGIVCSPPLPSFSGGVQCDLGDQEE
ncbi:hypothetical protein PanWU01x14_099970 [Parasponia andersonii]|uniref:Uncharacterized protein n=1 Tax=Parasponia andersonii TaxID=3476 RepID=A0A2P5D3F7_PARAD|nr:hypothetical protein PanWU01x14_099970 [Parasponia andersonii]